MSDVIDEISVSSNNDNDTIGDLVIEQMSISEIALYRTVHVLGKPMELK